MKLYRLALIFLISCAFAQGNAQSFADLNNRRGDNSFHENSFEVYLRRTQVAPKFNDNYGGTTINLKWRWEGYEKGERRWHFENPTLGDLIFVVARQVKGDTKILDEGDQAFGSGFFGWHQVYWNVVAQDRLLVSPGVSFGDYIFGTTRPASAANNAGQTLDPAGYFFHIGPAIMATKIIGNSFWLNAYGRYDLTGRAAKPSTNYVAIDGYKRPHFLGLGTSIQHAGTRLCGGINYTQLIDRGPNKDGGSRIDISFGYMF